MKTDLIFVGNIKLCKKYFHRSFITNEVSVGRVIIDDDSIGTIEVDSRIYKKNAILIKTKNGGYVDLDNLDLMLQLYLATMSKKEGFYPSVYPRNLIMPLHAGHEGGLFVDEESLRPCYEAKQEFGEKVSVKQLRTMKK